MAEQRILRGWSEAELASRLAALEGLEETVDEEARRDMRGGLSRWHPERSEAVIAREAPGPPLPDGPFERARGLLAAYCFSDPSIVRAYFDPERPLLGRRMLIEIRVLGLRYLCGTVVASVRDEQTERESTFGYRYDTLEGHIERGEEWFLIRKDHATGVIRFTIASRWRRGAFPNWWSRAGFSVLAGHYRARWLRRAHARMRAMLEGPAQVTAVLAVAGALSGARTMAGPLAAALAIRGRSGPHAPLIALMALAELLADKHPRITSRVAAFPWLGRIAAGAVAGAALAPHSARAGALLGGATAGAATKLTFDARAKLGARLGSARAGLVEDAIVYGVCLAVVMLVRRRS